MTTSNGTTEISAADQFTYLAAPSITEISPASGGTYGGTQVLINGAGLANASEVVFTGETFGDQELATIVSDTDNQILVSGPIGNPGTADVTVVTPGGTSAILPADQFTYMQSPSINNLQPVSGPLEGGMLVTIAGGGLSGAQSVLFGANPGTIFSDTANQIQAISPAGVAGTVDVTVVTQYGTSPAATDFFTFTPPPVVTGIDQMNGPQAGGTQVTISGSNLSGATEVDFGGAPATSFIVNNDGTLTAFSPAGAGSTVDVTVVTPGGISATSSADQFTYVAAPNVSAISPTSGPISGGTHVTITGTDLGGAIRVDFNDGLGDDLAGAILSDTSGQMLVVSPSFGFGVPST